MSTPDEKPAECPHCHETTRAGTGKYANWHYTSEKLPHASPFDCIKALHARLKNAEDTLERHSL